MKIPLRKHERIIKYFKTIKTEQYSKDFNKIHFKCSTLLFLTLLKTKCLTSINDDTIYIHSMDYPRFTVFCLHIYHCDFIFF